MTDWHTHILPGMDDGARDVETSLAMLRAEYAQGVDTVALTSHFYGDRESVSSFLRRREEAYARLSESIDRLPVEERERLPRLVLGAEVTWVPQILRWGELDPLCYAGSEYLLLEMPFAPWGVQVFRSLYDIMNGTGLTPVIAHLDRYRGTVSKSQMEELFSIGLPVQLSAETFLHFSTRGWAMRLLREGKAHMLISDAHDLNERPVNMGAAMAAVERRSPELLEELAWFTVFEND